MTGEKPLKGKVALVTGGARRIGRAIALGLAEQGAKVAVHYRNSEQEATTTVREIEALGTSARSFRADLFEVEAIRKLVSEVEGSLGPVDILINNAAVFGRTPWDQVTEADWDRFLDTNLKAQFFCAQSVAGGMKERGHGVIINMGSAGGIEVWPSFIPYSVAKAGLHHMTRLLARALAPEVRVNAIAPGTVVFGEGDEGDEKFARKAPLRRVGEGRDVAETALFLCTSADFITGQVFVVDGGHSLV